MKRKRPTIVFFLTLRYQLSILLFFISLSVLTRDSSGDFSRISSRIFLEKSPQIPLEKSSRTQFLQKNLWVFLYLSLRRHYQNFVQAFSQKSLRSSSSNYSQAFLQRASIKYVTSKLEIFYPPFVRVIPILNTMLVTLM